jgi:hypothetical protein
MRISSRSVYQRKLLFEFLQECPCGIVQEDTFKEIYAKFFPYGRKYNMIVKWFYDYKLFDSRLQHLPKMSPLNR